MDTPGNQHFEQESWTFEQFDSVRKIMTVIAIALMVSAAGFAGAITAIILWWIGSFFMSGVTNYFVGMLGGLATGGIVLGMCGAAFYFNSFRRADPETVEKFIPKLFGRFVNILLGPGLVYFPLYTICSFFRIFGYEAMDGQEFTLSFDMVERMPKDKAEVKYTTFFYLTANPNDPVELINIGGIPGAFNRVIQQSNEFLRDFITSPVIGPQTFDQARAMGIEAVNYIGERFELTDFDVISPEIPTQALLGFLRDRQLSDFEKDVKKKFDAKSPDEQKYLLRKAHERMELIEELRNGEHGPIALHHLGLWMVSIGIGDVVPAGATAKYLDEVVKAEQDANVTNVKVGAFKKNVAILQKTGLGAEEAAETVQLIQKLATKTVAEHKHDIGDNLAQTLKDLGSSLLGPLINRFAGGNTGGKG